jgi:flagellar hook-basal body complex protein FliE
MADMAISPVAVPLTAPAPPRATVTGPGGFGDLLGRALADVNDLQLRAHEAASALASGRPVNVTETVVAVEKASISLQFALQVRNKLLEAYQEIMRMQV